MTRAFVINNNCTTQHQGLGCNPTAHPSLMSFINTDESCCEERARAETRTASKRKRATIEPQTINLCCRCCPAKITTAASSQQQQHYSTVSLALDFLPFYLCNNNSYWRRRRRQSDVRAPYNNNNSQTHTQLDVELYRPRTNANCWTMAGALLSLFSTCVEKDLF